MLKFTSQPRAVGHDFLCTLFYRKSELQMFLLISSSHIGAPIWRLHTKLYKGV